MSAPSHKKGCTTSICVKGCTVEAARQLLLTGKRKQLDNGEKKENKILKRRKNEDKDDEDGEEKEEEQEEEQGSGDEEEDLEQEEEAEAVPPVGDIDSSTFNSGTLHVNVQLQLTQQLTL